MIIAVGLYRTSDLVRKSGKFSKSGLLGNRTFSFPDAGLLTLQDGATDLKQMIYAFKLV